MKGPSYDNATVLCVYKKKILKTDSVWFSQGIIFFSEVFPGEVCKRFIQMFIFCIFCAWEIFDRFEMLRLL